MKYLYLAFFLISFPLTPSMQTPQLMMTGKTSRDQVNFTDFSDWRVISLYNKFALLIKLGLQNGLMVREAVISASSFMPTSIREQVLLFKPKIALGASQVEIWKSDSHPRLAELFKICFLIEQTGANGMDILDAYLEKQLKERREIMLTMVKQAGVKIAIPLGVCYLPAFMLLGVMPIIYQLAKSIMLHI